MTRKRKFLIALSSFAEFDDAPLRLLKESGCEYVLNPYGRRLKGEEVMELARDCDGILAGLEVYDESMLEQLPRLTCISRCGTGLDNIPQPKAKQLGISVKSTPDAPVIAVAEMAIGLMLDLLRKISLHNEWVKKKTWQREIGSLLYGKKVGILGLGRIGRRVAELLQPFGAEVYGADLSPDTTWAKKYNVKIVNTRKLIETVDILSLHLSTLEGEEFRLDREAIYHMKRGAYLINLARGKIVDETALYTALKEGHLGGAALDVFSTEPYTGPLCELPNVILTPHIGAFTRESRTQMEVEAVRNLLNSPESRA